jgi:hypothetical protein
MSQTARGSLCIFVHRVDALHGFHSAVLSVSRPSPCAMAYANPWGAITRISEPPAGVGSDRTQMSRLDPEPWKKRAAPEFKGLSRILVRLSLGEHLIFVNYCSGIIPTRGHV